MRRLGAIAATIALCADAGSAHAEDKSEGKKVCLADSEQGQNQRDEGHYRAARESFLACARDSCPKLVAQSCTKWLRELDQEAPTVVLGAKDEKGNDLTDVSVAFDHRPFAAALDGKPLEADAGEHVLRFEREGSLPVEQKLVLRAGEKARVVTVTLKSANPEPVVATEEVKPAAPREEGAPPEPLFSSRHVTVGAMVLGALAAGGVGAAFLLKSNQDKDSAASLRASLASNACARTPGPPQCSSLAAAVSSEHQEMGIATGLLAGAAALAAGAVVTWLVWPDGRVTRPPAAGAIVPLAGGAALEIGGDFR